MIIEGKWERVDPKKAKSKAENAKPVKVEVVPTEPAKPEDTQFAAAVDAYFEQLAKSDSARAAEEQDDAFKEKLAGLKEHLKDRGSRR
jgi:hypothetical protein